MPQFCRHNRLLQNCTICSREQAVEPRPLVSSSAPRVAEPRRTAAKPPGQARQRSGASPQKGARVTVRRVRESSDDGFRSPLTPGLKSSQEAQRLAEEMAFAQTRLDLLASAPPGLYAEVADPSQDLEERGWLAFLIAYLGPLEDGADPFAAISQARTAWGSEELPRLDGVRTGPRSAYDTGRWRQTIRAYRGWAKRAGGQGRAFAGEAAWTEERRFARIYERLALPGLSRDARFELLSSLGALGVYELRAGGLVLSGTDLVAVAAKRALGIGDPILLERRAAQLAGECGVSLAALDLALYNWERGERARVGAPSELVADAQIVAQACRALGLGSAT